MTESWVSLGFTGCALAVASGVQFFLHLQPFVGYHSRISPFGGGLKMLFCGGAT
jgi:hypothetical protein